MNKLKRWIARVPELMREWIWLGHYMKRYWLSISFYIALGLLGVAMGLIVSVAQKNLINAVTAENKILKDILSAASVVISLAVFQIFLTAGANWVSTRISIRVINEVREDIFKKIIATRWESLVGYHSGDIINRLEGDVSTISNGIIGFIPNLITRLAQFIGAFAIILYHDPTMAIFAFFSAPVLMITGRPLMKIMRKHNEKMRDINGRILGFNEEVFHNIQMVKAFDLGATYCRNLRTLQAEYKKIRLDYNRVTIAMGILMGFIGLIAGYSCYAWGVYRLYVGAINYGEMTLFISLTGTLSGAFSGLVHIVPSAITTATAAGRVMEVTRLPSESDEYAAEVKALGEAAREQGVRLQVRDVSFRYKDAESDVLSHVSFDVEPGQVVAFVGPSGGGKTTILRLMLALLQAREGSITVSSADGTVSMPLTESIRRLCAYVPQGNSIFSGTVESNLRTVKPDATEEEIINALKAADAWNFLSVLPDTYRSVVGEKGHNFSEGQLQRISIARAMLRDAPILVMDEATSALDIDTEARVLRRIMSQKPNRICLITTHRASMLEYSDVIYRVDGDGSFQRLNSAADLRVSDLQPDESPAEA
jgi:ABC-type multidrug transport system fused ATPase/permease subunit